MKEDCLVRYWEQDCPCDDIASYGLPCARMNPRKGMVITEFALTTHTAEHPPEGPCCRKCGKAWKLLASLKKQRLKLS